MTIQSVTATVNYLGEPGAKFEVSYTGRLYPIHSTALKDAQQWREAADMLVGYGLKPPHFDASAQVVGPLRIGHITVYPWFDLASSEAKAAQVAWAETEKAAFDAATKDKGRWVITAPGTKGPMYQSKTPTKGWWVADLAESEVWGIEHEAHAACRVFSAEHKARVIAYDEAVKLVQKDKGDGLGRIAVWSRNGHSDYYWTGFHWDVQRRLAHIYPNAACAANAVLELKKGIPEGDSITVIITTDPPTMAKDKGPWVIQRPTLTGPEFWTGKGWSSDPRDAFQYHDEEQVRKLAKATCPQAELVSMSEV